MEKNLKLYTYICVCVYIYKLNHFSVCLKLAQYWKSIVL